MDDFFRQMKEREELMRRLAEGPAAELMRNQQTQQHTAASEGLRRQNVVLPECAVGRRYYYDFFQRKIVRIRGARGK